MYQRTLGRLYEGGLLSLKDVEDYLLGLGLFPEADYANSQILVMVRDNYVLRVDFYDDVEGDLLVQLTWLIDDEQFVQTLVEPNIDLMENAIYKYLSVAVGVVGSKRL